MPTTRLSFADVADLEPRVKALELLAKRAAPNAGGDPDYMVFLREVKPLVVALVGWHRGWLDVRETLERPEGMRAVDIRDIKMPSYPRPDNEVEKYLRSSEAYDVVYDHLVEVIGAG